MMRYVWIGRNGGIQVFSVEAVARLWEQAYGGKVVRTFAVEVNLERLAA
jgi:hypothetical protein